MTRKPRSAEKQRAAKEIDPRAKALADVDAHVARLSALKEVKKAELEADEAKHALHQDEKLQGRLEDELDRLEQDLDDLHERRFAIECGPDVPSAPAASTTRAEREWEIPDVAEPDYPAASKAIDEAAVEKAYQQCLDHHASETMRLFQKAGLPPDRKVSAELVAVSLGVVRGAVKWHTAAIKALSERIADLEDAPIRYRGVWQRSDQYERGHVVTESGSAWHAVRQTKAGERPGDSDAWQLMIKSGRDGKDAR